MTRRKPLSKRITALSLARNLTQKQEHQLVAMADRARHMEAELVQRREQEARLRALADTYARGRGGPTARRILAALDGTSEFEQHLLSEMRKPIGSPAEQAALTVRTSSAIESLRRNLQEQEFDQ